MKNIKSSVLFFLSLQLLLPGLALANYSCPTLFTQATSTILTTPFVDKGQAAKPGALLGKITNKKETGFEIRNSAFGDLNVRVSRDASGEVNHVAIRQIAMMSSTSSPLSLGEILTEATRNLKTKQNIIIEVNQYLTLRGAGEISGFRVDSGSASGIKNADVRVNQFIESIGSGQTFTSVSLQNADLPDGLSLTIGGEIKRIEKGGKYEKQKCE